MITGMQIRLARTALRWSVSTLSDRSEISTSTIKRIEAADGLPISTKANILAITSVLEAEGIKFIGTVEDHPGVSVNLAKKRPPGS